MNTGGFFTSDEIHKFRALNVNPFIAITKPSLNAGWLYFLGAETYHLASVVL